MSFQRWKVLKYKRLHNDSSSEENEVSIIIDNSLREIIVYSDKKKKESVIFSKDPDEFPKIKIRDQNLYVLLNSKLDGFRLTFQPDQMAGISKSFEHFWNNTESTMVPEGLSESQCSSPFSLPSVVRNPKFVQHGFPAPSPHSQRVDKAVQTDDSSEDLLENDEFVLSCMKLLMKNKEFGQVVKSVRAQVGQMRDDEFHEVEEKTAPNGSSVTPPPQAPPNLEHTVSDQEFDNFFTQSNL